MDKFEGATFILIVKNDEEMIDDVMEFLVEDYRKNDELIIVLNNSNDNSDNKIDKYLTKFNSNVKFIIANGVNEDEALLIGKENSKNNTNFIIYGNIYNPTEWIKNEQG